MRFLMFQLLVCLLNPTLSRSKEDMRATILSALEKATLFLRDSYNEINVDAVLGYRILQAYLSGVLEKWESQPGLQSSRERVVCLEKKLSTLIDKAERAVEENTPNYYREFAPSLGPGFWKIPHQWMLTDPSLAPSLNNSSGCLKENISDSCISHLLGTWGDGGEPCVVPDYCPDMMTTIGCSGYSLSHQLFYFMFADMKECLDPLFLDAPYYKNVFCASMKEININGEKQARLNTIGDLFVENSDQFQSSNQTSGEHRQGLKRVKRQEKILKGGCSSHNSAVAVAALGGFLHYMVFDSSAARSHTDE